MHICFCAALGYVGAVATRGLRERALGDRAWGALTALLPAGRAGLGRCRFLRGRAHDVLPPAVLGEPDRPFLRPPAELPLYGGFGPAHALIAPDASPSRTTG